MYSRRTKEIIIGFMRLTKNFKINIECSAIKKYSINKLE